MKNLLSKYFQKALWLLLFAFMLMNIVAFAHAYKFTHFSGDATARTKDLKDLTWLNKFKILFIGIDNPKPQHKSKPHGNFDVITIGITDRIQCWYFKAAQPKGTVILFHGFGSEKSSLLGRSEYFNTLGYNTMLVDFLGSGDSDGMSTSIGFYEADQVLQCYNYIVSKGEKNIFLFGTSMGAASILKAINDHKISPSTILLECPFGSLYSTVCARFRMMNLPAFPMAALLTFWGGVQQDFWAFAHNTSEYAKAVNCPTLLLYGEFDDRVTHEETDLIYANLNGLKSLKTYGNEGHNFYTPTNESAWKRDVGTFMRSLKNNTNQLMES
jgi:pimeloyl-ACP methyl ester carboxylesterase